MRETIFVLFALCVSLAPEGPWNLLHVVAFRLKKRKTHFKHAHSNL